MASYVQLDARDVAEISARYELAPTSFEPMAGGWGNSSFRLRTAEGTYVLTVFDQQPVETVERLAQLLRHLERYGFPTTRVVARVGGGYSTRHKGKPILLKRWLEGRVVEQLTVEMLQQAGAALATIHAVPPPGFLTTGHSYELDVYQGVVDHRGADAFAAWFSARKAELDRAMAPTLPSGLIHGDLFFDNILFAGDELRVIDFEEACRHCFVFDLGMAIVGLATESWRVDFGRAIALIDGYQRVRPLAGVERAALRPAVAYAAAGTACWRYWKFRIHSPSTEYRERFREMVELADAVRRMPEEELIAALLGS